MGSGDTVLIGTSSITQIFPSWWIPTAENLASISPGRTHVKVRAVTIGQDGGADLSTATSIWIAVEQVEEGTLTGTIESSPMDRDGFRRGDQVETTTDRVWDYFNVGDDGHPEINEDRAVTMVGKTALVGITQEGRSRKKPPELSQIVGTIDSIDATAVRLRLRDGTPYDLPPDIRPFEYALPGEYRLRSTGEVVTDPDFICAWVSTPRLQAL